jgi:glucan phosphoethanolaminetransferase (alkaline phosphatase superfamily)
MSSLGTHTALSLTLAVAQKEKKNTQLSTPNLLNTRIDREGKGDKWFTPQLMTKYASRLSDFTKHTSHRKTKKRE